MIRRMVVALSMVAGAGVASAQRPTQSSIAVDGHALTVLTAGQMKPGVPAVVLAAMHVSPPYVLVGHSYGGPIIHTFAARYPTEVAGLVYIDPTDFTQTRDDMCAVAKAAGLASCAALSKLNDQLLGGAPPGLVAEAQEVNRAEADGFAELRADGDAPVVPTVVLLAGKPQPWPPGFPVPATQTPSLPLRSSSAWRISPRSSSGCRRGCSC